MKLQRSRYTLGMHSIVLETSWDQWQSGVITPPFIEVYCHGLNTIGAPAGTHRFAYQGALDDEVPTVADRMHRLNKLTEIRDEIREIRDEIERLVQEEA